MISLFNASATWNSICAPRLSLQFRWKKTVSHYSIFQRSTIMCIHHGADGFSHFSLMGFTDW